MSAGHGHYQHEIDSDVNAVEIQNDLQFTGTQAAAKTMLADVNEARQKGNFPAAYESNLATDLAKEGVLPDLAIGWSRENFGLLSDKAGRITEPELKRLETLSAGEPLTNSLIRALEHDLPEMEQQAGTGDKGIALSDFSKVFYARQLESERQFNDNIKSIPEMNSLKQLFAGHSKLLNSLIDMHVKGTGTGILGHVEGFLDWGTGTFNHDTLKAFAARVSADPQFAKQWSAADKAAVSDLDKNWNEAKLIPLRDGDLNRMGGESIEDGLGLYKTGRQDYEKVWLQGGDLFDKHHYKLPGVD